MDGRAAKKQRTEPRAPVAVTRHSDIAVHTWLHFSAFSSCTRPMLSCSPPSSLERCRITSVNNLMSCSNSTWLVSPLTAPSVRVNMREFPAFPPPSALRRDAEARVHAWVDRDLLSLDPKEVFWYELRRTPRSLTVGCRGAGRKTLCSCAACGEDHHLSLFRVE